MTLVSTWNPFFLQGEGPAGLHPVHGRCAVNNCRWIGLNSDFLLTGPDDSLFISLQVFLVNSFTYVRLFPSLKWPSAKKSEWVSPSGRRTYLIGYTGKYGLKM